ncbi:hypothetical protein GZ77_11140 [Endozoicomonas montiporae]|uniref:Uncharacterized protein n=2 Tax=Endozoicomonas montiporae TaxID=1027273 RepID=A0A081N8Q1_9GAMM|nr:DUF6776 family protein [Endozoicomonas montiporae]AMO55272.1 hypothetical protein EZMO1_1068 [Endozoicomonas montiporae CL-33]KEQ14824.1 hypothetical protein GZ77_11140 [Endozoicomonas montiporae]
MAFDPDQDSLNPAGGMRVVRHDPVRERRLQWLLVALFISFGVVAYWFGASRVVDESEGLKQDNRQLTTNVARLESQNEKLASRVAVLERSSRIDRQAAENVRVQVRELEQEKAEMSKTMTFYQSVIAPEDLNEGVRLNAFDLMPGDKPNQYRLRVVVSQVSRSNNFLRGGLRVRVTGKQDDKPASFSLLELAGVGDNPALGFRYFQSFPDDRGLMDFELPENFKPESITVNVNIRSGGARNLEESFDWHEELAADVGQK